MRSVPQPHYVHDVENAISGKSTSLGVQVAALCAAMTALRSGHRSVIRRMVIFYVMNATSKTGRCGDMTIDIQGLSSDDVGRNWLRNMF
jgi:hypothetical protein